MWLWQFLVPQIAGTLAPLPPLAYQAVYTELAAYHPMKLIVSSVSISMATECVEQNKGAKVIMLGSTSKQWSRQGWREEGGRREGRGHMLAWGA